MIARNSPALDRSLAGVPIVHAMLAEALNHHRLGELMQAELAYRRILAIDPEHADALHLLGMLAHQTGNSELAAHLIRRAIDIHPGAASYHSNLGNVLFAQGLARESAACYLRALAINPNLAEVHVNLGNVFLAAELYVDAIEWYRRALIIQPESAEAYNNLASALRLESKLEESAACYRQALALKPDYTEAHHDLGRVLRALGDLDGALAHFREACRLDPGHPRAWFAESMVLLLQANWRAGWQCYESRWSSIDHGTPMRRYSQSMWRGEKLDSGRLFLWPEQGVGDEVMFAGVIPDVIRTGNSVVLGCDTRLVPLLRRSFAHRDTITIIESNIEHTAEPANVTAHLPVGSLPGIFRASREAFARHPAAYLKADLAQTRALRRSYACARLDGDRRPLVGLAWYTNNAQTGAGRSIDLASLAPLMESSEISRKISWISLQYGDPVALKAQAETAGVSMVIDDSVDQLADIDRFASQIAAVDMVLTIDNSTAHLAGALGVAVWVMLPFAPDWRWGATGDKCLWYPSMRLFRQTKPGDWSSVVINVQQALGQYAFESARTNC